MLVCVSLPCSVLFPLLLEGDLFSKGDEGAGEATNGGGAVAPPGDCGGRGRSSIALACLGRTALTPEVSGKRKRYYVRIICWFRILVLFKGSIATYQVGEGLVMLADGM